MRRNRSRFQAVTEIVQRPIFAISAFGTVSLQRARIHISKPRPQGALPRSGLYAPLAHPESPPRYTPSRFPVPAPASPILGASMAMFAVGSRALSQAPTPSPLPTPNGQPFGVNSEHTAESRAVTVPCGLDLVALIAPTTARKMERWGWAL